MIDREPLLDEQPLEFTRSAVVASGDAFIDEAPPASRGPRPNWSAEAEDRLARVPSFVRGMVKKIYSDYARERSIAEITPEVMDRAREELGLEGM